MTLYVILATNIVSTEMDRSREKRQLRSGLALAKSIGVLGFGMT